MENNGAVLDRDLVILMVTSIPWEKYRTDIKDKEVFDRIIVAIQQTSEKNESLLYFQKKIDELGDRGKKVVVQIVSKIKESGCNI